MLFSGNGIWSLKLPQNSFQLYQSSTLKWELLKVPKNDLNCSGLRLIEATAQ